MRLLTFVETKLFSRLADEYLGDEGMQALQEYLSAQPEAGKVIQGSGGVRKLRWAAPGRGKQGGLRVIYLLRRGQGEVWLLTLYPKNVTANISAAVLKKIKASIDG